MAQSLVAQEWAPVQAFHYLAVAFAGKGFTMPFGLLMAGVSVTAGVRKLLPKWIVVLGRPARPGPNIYRRWILANGNSINDRREIAGTGRTKTGAAENKSTRNSNGSGRPRSAALRRTHPS